MIDALLNKISGIFENDYLFGSVLPALLFLFAAAGTFVLVVGPATAGALINQSPILGSTSPILSTALFGTGLIAFTYLLSALRPAFLRFWSGASGRVLLAPFHFLGREWQRRKFRRLHQRAFAASNQWSEALANLRQGSRSVWGRGAGVAPPQTVSSLKLRARSLHPKMDRAAIQRSVDEVVEAYASFTVASLGNVYGTLQTRLLEMDSAEAQRQRLLRVELDKRFGDDHSIAPTELGNIIQSYNDYPFKRYCMEGEVFWPRLLRVIEENFGKLVQSQQTQLDFSVTCASLSILYTILWLIVGPRLWSNPWIWLGIAGCGLLASSFFYGLGCIAARKLGDLFRASFDLFRLELIKELGVVAPKTVKEERALWGDLSTLVVYGGAIAEVKDIHLQQ